MTLLIAQTNLISTNKADMLGGSSGEVENAIRVTRMVSDFS